MYIPTNAVMPQSVRDPRRHFRYKPGDRVRVFGVIRPEELRWVGLTGTVTDVWTIDTQVTAELDAFPGRFYAFMTYELDPWGPKDYTQIDEGGVV